MVVVLTGERPLRPGLAQDPELLRSQVVLPFFIGLLNLPGHFRLLLGKAAAARFGSRAGRRAPDRGQSRQNGEKSGRPDPSSSYVVHDFLYIPINPIVLVYIIARGLRRDPAVPGIQG